MEQINFEKFLRKFSLMLAVFLLVSVIAVPGPALAGNPLVGKVIGISGTVEYTYSAFEENDVKNPAFEKWHRVQFHQAVYAQDAFRTAQGSRLKILFIDNSLVALGPNSEMRVESYLFDQEAGVRQSVLNLVRGLSMFLLENSGLKADSSFKIESTAGSLSVLGSQGYAKATESRLHLVNSYGAVLTRSNDDSMSPQPESFAITPVSAQAKESSSSLTFLSQAELNNLQDLILGPAGLIAAVAQQSVGSFLNVIEEGDLREDDESNFGLFEDEMNVAPEKSDSQGMTETFGLKELLFQEGEGLGDPDGLNFKEFNDPFDADLLLWCKFNP